VDDLHLFCADTKVLGDVGNGNGTSSRLGASTGNVVSDGGASKFGCSLAKFTRATGLLPSVFYNELKISGMLRKVASLYSYSNIHYVNPKP
jgi:hypothetical protein